MWRDGMVLPQDYPIFKNSGVSNIDQAVAKLLSESKTINSDQLPETQRLILKLTSSENLRTNWVLWTFLK
jgi:hypothetical protein